MQSQADCRYGMAEQSVWGEAVADAGAVIQLNCKPFHLSHQGELLRLPGSHGVRNTIQGDLKVLTPGAMIEFEISGVASKGTLDFFLAGAFQVVTEAAGTPYEKTFVYQATQPIFETGNAGYTLTVFERAPTASESWKVKDVIVKKLVLSLTEHGVLMYTASCVGRGIPVASTPSGTWTRETQTTWHADDLARVIVDFGGGSQNFKFKGLVWTMENEIIRCGGGSGDFTTYGIASRRWQCDLRVYKDANAPTAIANWKATTPLTVHVGWEASAAADKYLDITHYGTLISEPDFSNDKILDVQLSVEAAGANASTTPITVVLCNTFDRGW